MAVDATTQLHHNDLLIGDENVPAATGESFDTVSPTTNEPVRRMAKAGVEEVDRAVAARKALNEGPWPRITPLGQSREYRLPKDRQAGINNCAEQRPGNARQNGGKAQLNLDNIGTAATRLW